ncbi:MAG: hypothetical protein WCJ37_20120, partial [Syntrophus sp. (in: bacteria)]
MPMFFIQRATEPMLPGNFGFCKTMVKFSNRAEVISSPTCDDLPPFVSPLTEKKLYCPERLNRQIISFLIRTKETLAVEV